MHVRKALQELTTAVNPLASNRLKERVKIVTFSNASGGSAPRHSETCSWQRFGARAKNTPKAFEREFSEGVVAESEKAKAGKADA